MDQMRSRALEGQEVGDAVLEEMIDSQAEQVLLTLERRESEQALRQIMRESLDATEAKVMTLHYVEELPLDSITRLLALNNQSGAKAYIVSARRKLNRGFAHWKVRASRTKEG